MDHVALRYQVGEVVTSSGSRRATLGQRRSPQLGEDARALDLPEPPDPSSTLGTLAEKLEIHVSRGGKTSARVGLPAGAVERLGDFLDDDLRERIAARGIVLDDLVADTRRRGYAPGVLFDLDDGERRFEVRLA